MAHSDTLIFLTNITWIFFLFLFTYFFFVTLVLSTFYKKFRTRAILQHLPYLYATNSLYNMTFIVSFNAEFVRNSATLLVRVLRLANFLLKGALSFSSINKFTGEQLVNFNWLNEQALDNGVGSPNLGLYFADVSSETASSVVFTRFLKV